jgi:hypothetical protein
LRSLSLWKQGHSATGKEVFFQLDAGTKSQSWPEVDEKEDRRRTIMTCKKNDEKTPIFIVANLKQTTINNH